MKAIRRWKQRAQTLGRDVVVIYLAAKDPRVPWYAKVLALCVVGYALSPIDLIPDPIPVLGYLDDLILIPLGILLVHRLIPPEVIEACRPEAERRAAVVFKARWVAAAIILLLWIVLILALYFLISTIFG